MTPLEAKRKGWQLRGVYDDPKLTQIVNMHEELGFAVKCMPASSDVVTGCDVCFNQSPDNYEVIYTKKNDS